MKKDYSKVFGHYYGLQYDGNVGDMIVIHQLMEDAGMQVSSSTKEKLAAYSDKRPFRVNYFISKVGKTLKWCPTNSPERFLRVGCSIFFSFLHVSFKNISKSTFYCTISHV